MVTAASSCVVVVEDDPATLNLLRDLLHMEGFEVLTVSRPDLLDQAVARSAPRLFLLDVMLPGASGVEVASRLRQGGFAETPMFALSASKLMRQIADESGIFQATFDKPFEIPALLRQIRQYTA